MFYNNINKIDEQMRQLQNLKAQMQAPMIQQNFLQPMFISDFDSKWVDNKEEVKNIQVNRETILMNRNEPIFYIKSVNNEIKTYKFEEFIELDEKELLKQEISQLKEEIEIMKGKLENEPDKFINDTTISSVPTTTRKSKPQAVTGTVEK